MTETFDPATRQSDGHYHLNSEYIGRLFSSRPGLIVGPDLVHYPAFVKEVTEAIMSRWEVEAADSYFDAAQKALQAGASHIEVEQLISNMQQDAVISPQAKLLGKAYWTGVLSFCQSGGLDSLMLTASSRMHTRKAPHIVNDPVISLQPRSFPVCKMLGTVTHTGYVVTKNELTRRRVRAWRQLVPLFSDLVRQGPVLCVGMSSQVDLLIELFAEMEASPKTIPHLIAFLSDEPVSKNIELAESIPSATTSTVIHCTVGEFIDASERASKTQYTIPLDASSVPAGHELVKFSDVAVHVNTQLTSSIEKEQQHLLRDILFQPTSCKWDAFSHDLDFQRQITSEIIQKSDQYLKSRRFDSTSMVVSGSSGSGKTTILKRAAYDLAKTGYQVLWIRPTFEQDAPARLNELFKSVSQLGTQWGRLVVFFDDPFTHSSLSARDIASAADHNRVQLLLITSGKSSDWAQYDDRTDVTGGLPIDEIIEIQDQLSDDEVATLPKYLVDLGIASDEVQAETEVNEAVSKHARDLPPRFIPTPMLSQGCIP